MSTVDQTSFTDETARESKNKKLPEHNRFCVHPGVGVARVGDSEQGFFIGPEASGWNPLPADGSYKDAQGKIKRQAARFRVYEYDPAGKPVREICAKDGTITWTVHIANKKGAWYEFAGKAAWKSGLNRVLRNKDIEGDQEPDLRKSLIIDPGPRSVTGFNATPATFDGGSFLGKPVNLGEIRTDSNGRLLVLGGDGSASTVNDNNPLAHFANNDGWQDNIADGWVEATICLPDGSTHIAERAWVIVAPPAFVPQMQSLVTLNDLMQEVAKEQGWQNSSSNEVLFYRDVFPLLQRTDNFGWVSDMAFRGHGSGKYGSFTDEAHLKVYSDASASSQARRQKTFSVLRDPQASDALTSSEDGGNMPLLYGTGGVDENKKPLDWFTVLPSQYTKMKAWAEGNFTLDNMPAPRPLEEYELDQQPAALDRAALEYCAGGPFFPGIEMTFIAAEASTWRAPYRIASSWGPGDVTKWMALPWHSDFYECTLHWWPIQRPDAVLTESDFEAKLINQRQSWTRGISEGSLQGNNEMVNYWSSLGFVLPSLSDNEKTIYVEKERGFVD